MVKIGKGRWFLLGQTELRLAQLETLHHKRHVSAQRAHGLQPLRVLLYFLRRSAVHHVPVLCAGNRHAGHGEILVQHVEGRGIAAATTGNYCRAHLHGFVHAQRAEKQPVHKGNRAARRRGKVYRRTDDEGVRLRQLGRNFIDNIIKHAFARFVTFAAGDAAANILVANVNQLNFYAFRFQRFFSSVRAV